jgi:hypothetical protein
MRARCLALLAGLAIGMPAVAAESVFVTWAGSEPDKGASLWYLVRHVSPGARIRVVPAGTMDLGEGTAVDTPLAKYRRTHQLATLETILLDHPTQDPIIQHLAAIMHDIEINLWRPKRYPESAPLERTLLGIGARYPENSVPTTCFLAFFDGVHSWLAATPRAETPPVPAVCDPAHPEAEMSP